MAVRVGFGGVAGSWSGVGGDDWTGDGWWGGVRLHFSLTGVRAGLGCTVEADCVCFGGVGEGEPGLEGTDWLAGLEDK